MQKKRGKGRADHSSAPVAAQPGSLPLDDTLRHPWVPRGLTLPQPYLVNMGGVHEMIPPAAPGSPPALRTIAERPVVPVGLVSHEDGRSLGEMRVVLAYMGTSRTKWYLLAPSRAVIADPNKLVDLASADLPVSRANAKNLSLFLNKMIEENGGRLPNYRLLHHMGWVEGGDGYLHGNTLITARGDVGVWVAGSSSGPPKGSGYVYDADSRDQWARQLPDALRPQGSLQTWIQAVAAVKDYPLALLVLYAGIVPILMPWLPVPNFVLQLAGITSTGKTSALRLAASIYGYPDYTRPDGGPGIIFGTATKVGAEGMATALSTLPVLLDDYHRIWMQSPQTAQEIMYLVASGTGKVRAAPWGMARHNVFRTVLILTSERDITQLAAFGGLSARTITISTPPFGPGTEATAKLLNTLKDRLLQNHGHAVREVVRYIMSTRPDLASMYGAWLQRVRAILGGWQGSVASRQTEYLAAIGVAGEILHQAIRLPWPDTEVMTAIVVSACQQTTERYDEARYALERLQSALHSRPHALVTAGEDVRGLREWAGIIWPGRMVAVLPQFLERALQDDGLDASAVVREWARRNWLKTVVEDGKLRYTLKIQYRGHRVRAYVIEWHAWSSGQASIVEEAELERIF